MGSWPFYKTETHFLSFNSGCVSSINRRMPIESIQNGVQRQEPENWSLYSKWRGDHVLVEECLNKPKVVKLFYPPHSFFGSTRSVCPLFFSHQQVSRQTVQTIMTMVYMPVIKSLQFTAYKSAAAQTPSSSFWKITQSAFWMLTCFINEQTPKIPPGFRWNMLLELITTETTLVLPAALKQKSRLKNLQVTSKLYRSVRSPELVH